MKNHCEKKLNSFGIGVPEILLPKNIDVGTWPVIACDQYTQDADYWSRAEACAAGKPSTLNLILPEVYLNSPDKARKIAEIRRTMADYLGGLPDCHPDSGIFDAPRKCMVYLERKTAFGRTRKGLVVQIDLETYEWKPFSRANIRATEATIVERIPPRMEIRRGAPLELPHIMLLVNDKNNLLVGRTGSLVKNNKPLYDGELMCNGGHITGWAVEDDAALDSVADAVAKIAQENQADDGSVFLFAVGDGNHSLATAKAVWDEFKAQQKKSAEELTDCPVRYALVEIVSIYDDGLTFEPIHRVIFNASAETLINHLAQKLGGTANQVQSSAELENLVKSSRTDFGFTYKAGESQKYVLLRTKIDGLAVSHLQPEIDTFLQGDFSDGPAPEIDYIHGSDEVLRLGSRDDAVGILLPPIAKDSFFETITARGPLPRKSFSMGEADEKRFYLECRKLFS